MNGVRFIASVLICAMGIDALLGATRRMTDIDVRGIFRATASGGDVIGPSSSTKNALVRFKSRSGKLIKNSSALLDDAGTLRVTKLGVGAAPVEKRLKVSGLTYINADGDSTDADTYIGRIGKYVAIIGDDISVYNCPDSRVNVSNMMVDMSAGGAELTLIRDKAEGGGMLAQDKGIALFNANALTINTEASIGGDTTIGQTAKALKLRGQVKINADGDAEAAPTQIGDTTKGSRVGIGGAPASTVYALKVVGDMWVTGNLRVDGQRVSRRAPLPVGTILSYAGAGSKVPAGFVVCDGTQYDGSENSPYRELYEAIGARYGGMRGSKFNVPDLRAQSVVTRLSNNPDCAGIVFIIKY